MKDATQSSNPLPSPGGMTNAPINAEVLSLHCMGNAALAMALIAELEATGTEQVEAILQHAATGDFAEAAAGAHALKGASAIVGAQGLSAIAAQVEATGREEQFDRLPQLLSELAQEMNKCVSYIPFLREQTQRDQRPF